MKRGAVRPLCSHRETFERGAYSPKETFVGLANFQALLKDTKFIVSMQNTILLIGP